MSQNAHYELVANALDWIAEHQAEQPDLGRLARHLSISPHHLHRVFQAWAGVSPKRFLMSLTREAALQRLAAGETVLDAAMSAGLSGPGRLHDLLITTTALTPGEVRRGGEEAFLVYGFGDSPFGEALVGWHDRGLHFLGFRGRRSHEETLLEMTTPLPRASFRRDDAEATQWLRRIFDRSRAEPLPLWLRGSPFQLHVWEALLAIPEDCLASYGMIAQAIEKPRASRAVGAAVGRNPLAWIIPCHRVIRSIGEIGGYRWGATTKRAMIGLDVSGFRSRSF